MVSQQSKEMEKWEVLKAIKEENQLTYKGMTIREMADLSIAKQEARRE